MGHQICLIHILRRRATEGYTSSRGSPITRTAGIPRAIYEGLWERLTKNEKRALQQIFFIFLKNILGLQANYPPSTQIGRPTTFVLSNIQTNMNICNWSNPNLTKPEKVFINDKKFVKERNEKLGTTRSLLCNTCLTLSSLLDNVY